MIAANSNMIGANRPLPDFLNAMGMLKEPPPTIVDKMLNRAEAVVPTRRLSSSFSGASSSGAAGACCCGGDDDVVSPNRGVGDCSIVVGLVVVVGRWTGRRWDKPKRSERTKENEYRTRMKLNEQRRYPSSSSVQRGSLHRERPAQHDCIRFF